MSNFEQPTACVWCGLENPANSRFCIHCGRFRLIEAVCPACNAPNIEVDQRFCGECGNPLTHAAPQIETQTPTTPPPATPQDIPAESAPSPPPVATPTPQEDAHVHEEEITPEPEKETPTPTTPPPATPQDIPADSAPSPPLVATPTTTQEDVQNIPDEEITPEKEKTSTPAEKTSLHLLRQFKRILFHRSTYDFLMRHSGAIALVLFLVAGVLVLDDYGVTVDDDWQRTTATANINYVLGRDHDFIIDHNRFYGVAFELPLVLLERFLGEDIRSIRLSRHITTHIFFLVGGFFCYLLTYRMFNSRPLALIAMLLFLLHPRLYAHSFINTKDIPFFSMFMIALFLTHRALKKNDILTFLLCGLAVGVLINLRVMGVVLFATVLAMRVLDMYYASSNTERRHILITAAVFAVSSIWMLYLITPVLWSDPVRGALEWIPAIDQGTFNLYNIFRGGPFLTGESHPPEYVPVWASITTPPLVLVLGVIGTLTILFRYVMHPSDIFRNTTFRFGLVLIACVATPVAAAVYLDANLYNDWRQMYFLYAPFCLLAVFGLRWLVLNLENRRIRAGVYATTGATIAITIIAMAGMHPHQHVYFNFLVDRTTPEHLRTQYEMEYWGHSYREALEHLLERYPDTQLKIASNDFGVIGRMNHSILPQKDRERITIIGDPSTQEYDFYITNYRDIWHSGFIHAPSDPGIYTRTIYNNTLFTILDERR